MPFDSLDRMDEARFRYWLRQNPDVVPTDDAREDWKQSQGIRRGMAEGGALPQPPDGFGPVTEISGLPEPPPGFGPVTVFGPKPAAKPEPPPGTPGIVARSASIGLAPALTGAVAMGTGAQLGAIAGAATGPAAPIMVPVGALIGGAAAGMAGGIAGGWVQEKVLDAFPAFKKRIGQSDEQRAADEKEAPYWKFFANALPGFLVASPLATAPGVLSAGANAAQKLWASPKTARLAGAGFSAGQEAAGEVVMGEDIDYGKIGASALIGLAQNKLTKNIGEPLVGYGARPVQAVQDRFRTKPPPEEFGPQEPYGPNPEPYGPDDSHAPPTWEERLAYVKQRGDEDRLRHSRVYAEQRGEEDRQHHAQYARPDQGTEPPTAATAVDAVAESERNKLATEAGAATPETAATETPGEQALAGAKGRAEVDTDRGGLPPIDPRPEPVRAPPPFTEHQIRTGEPQPHTPVPAERGVPFERPVAPPVEPTPVEVVTPESTLTPPPVTAPEPVAPPNPLDQIVATANEKGVNTSVGPDPANPNAFVIDQINPATGRFDGHQVFIGYPDVASARDAYLGSFPNDDGAEHFGGASSLPLDGLRAWLDAGDIGRPLGEIPPATVHDFSGQNGPLFGVQPQFGRNSDEFKALGKAAVELGGQYDIASMSRGFLFPNEDAAIEFAKMVKYLRGGGGEPPAAEPPAPTPPPPGPGPTPPQPAPPAGGGTGETPPTSLAQDFADHFAAGNGFANIVEARRFAAERGADVTSNVGRKALDEAIEVGVTLHARQLVAEGNAAGRAPGEIFDALVDLYRRQPKLLERNSESARLQAYSTPAPIAYLASRLAGVTDRSYVYEPTAGNGALLVEANPASTLANEIDPARRATLTKTFINVTGEDGATFAPGVNAFDVVIANPPFGKLVMAGGDTASWQTKNYRTREIDHAIALKALEAMRDDGTAVLIIGSKPEIGQNGATRRKDFYNSAENRAFFKSLYDDYRVTDHFTLNGDLYAKQGAGWPIDVIRIQGRGKSDLALPGVNPPRILETFDALREKLNGTKIGAVGATGKQPGGDGGRGPVGDSDQTPIPPPNDGAGGANDQGGGRGRPGGDTPGDAATPPIVPEPTTGDVGAGDNGGGGTGGGGTRGSDATVPLPGGGQGAEPVGTESPAGGRPGDVVDVGSPEGKSGLNQDELNLFDDLFGSGKSTQTPQQPSEGGERQPSPPTPSPDAAGTSKSSTGRDATPPPGGWREGFGKLFEEAPYPERVYLDGVEPSTYEKALPHFTEAVKDLGYKTGDDVRPTMVKLVDQLKEDGFTPERLAAVRPYALQFMSDIKSGVVRFEEPVAASQRRANEEVETRLQTRYTPTSEARPVGTLVPVNMQTAITRSLDNLKARVEDIDDFVARKLNLTKADVVGTEGKPGVFSAEQVDAIAMMIDNLDSGRGFIIGDQTGTGKGRPVAAMIRYAQLQGKVPIFVTASEGLYADMYRDLRNIGMKDFNALFTNTGMRGANKIPLDSDGEYLEGLTNGHLALAFGQIRNTGALPPGYDALFTTYSQMQMYEGRPTPRHDVLDKLAPNAIFILDESHEAGGTDARPKVDKDTGQVILPRSQVIRNWLAQADGVIYSSATYAKNPHVMSLYFRTDMPIAVDGDVTRLVELIKSGGVPLQTAIANMLTEGGQMVRRERSWDGIEFKMQTVGADRATAERSSDLMRRIFELDVRMAHAREAYNDFLQQQGGAIGPDGAVGSQGAESTNFSSIMHNIISQSLLSLKADQAASEAIAAHQREEKPIIALSNTLGSLLHQYTDHNGVKLGDELNITFNNVFDNYLKRTRTVLVKDPFDSAKDFHHFITDAEMRDIGFGHLIKEYDHESQYVAKTDISQMPGSPLDHILDRMRAAGLRVGEITGRDLVVENGVLTKRNSSSAERKRMMNAFNAGEIDVLLINEAGSTGFSLHASEEYADQKPRHMFVLQGDPNIDTFMQILGRINRTGQVELPLYSLLVSDQPAEKRPAAMLMKKLGSLNANTSANKESAVTLADVVDMMNPYGDQIVGSMLSDNPALANMLDLHPNTEGDFSEGIASKSTGRLAIREIDEQIEFWRQAEESYNDLIDTLNRTGQNALEAKALPLEARTLDTTEVTADKGVDSPFGRPAQLERINVKRLGKPMELGEIGQKIATKLGVDDIGTVLSERDAGEATKYVRGLKIDLKGKTETYLEKFEADLEEANQHFHILEQHPDLQYPEKAPPIQALLDKAGHRLHNLISQIATTNDQLHIINNIIDAHPPGDPVMVTVGVGEKSEDFQGIILDISPNGKTTNPAALSGWVAHIAIADSARDLRIPLSQIVGKRNGDGTYEAGNTQIVRSDNETVRQAFEEGHSNTRENRYMVTGNLLAGYDAFSARGQFVMFSREDGSIEPGILLPRKMNPHKELEARPVPLSPVQALDFINQVNSANNYKRSGVVHSGDGVLKVQITDSGRYLLEAAKRGGAIYYLPKQVQEILGDADKFATRGNAWRATTNRSTAEKVLNWYTENLGTKFEARNDRDVARTIIGGTLSEETPYPNPRQQDRLQDYQTYAANAASDDHHQNARDYTLARGRESGFEHMVIYDASASEVAYATTSGLTDQVHLPDAMMTRAMEDPLAGFVIHHNHPQGRALSRLDIAEGLSYPGVEQVVAYGHDDSVAVARLSPEMQEHLAGRSYEQRKELLQKITGVADTAIDQKLWPLIKNDRLSRDGANRIYANIVNRSLDAAGVIDYVSSHESSAALGEAYTKNLVREAAERARLALAYNAKGFRLFDKERFNELVNRSTTTVLPEGGVGSLFGQNEGAASRPIGEGGDRGGRGLPEGGGEVRQGKLAEETPFPYAPPKEDVDAALRRNMVPAERVSLVQRAKDWYNDIKDDALTRFKQNAVDMSAMEDAFLTQAHGGAKPLANVSSVVRRRWSWNSSAIAAHTLGQRLPNGEFYGGVPEWVPPVPGTVEGGYFRTKEDSAPLVAALAPLEDHGVKEPWALWMIANRAEFLMSEGREHNVSAQDIAAYKDIDKQYLLPDGTNLFQQVKDDYVKFNKQMLDFGEATGVVNPDTRRMWDLDNYVPFYRATDSGPKGPGGGGKNVFDVTSPIRRLKGGKDKINDIYDNMANNVFSMVNRGMRNVADQALRDTAVMVGAMKPASKTARARFERSIDELMDTPEGRERLADLGLDPETMKADALQAARDLFGNLHSKDSNVHSVMENGKREYFEVSDKRLIRAIESFGPRETSAVRDLLIGTRQFMTKTISLEPTFMLAGSARDALHAWGSTGYNITPVLSTMKGIVSAYTRSPSELAIVGGGAVGTAHHYARKPAEMRALMQDPAYQKSLINTPKRAIAALERIGNATDHSNRIAIYEQAKKEGLGEAEALTRAQNLMPYEMRGDGKMMNFLVDTVPFLNARIQGVNRIHGGLKENPRTVMLRGAMVIAATLALWNENKDDPRYQALEDWDKDYAWHFFLPVGSPVEHFRLPRPFEFGAFFARIPEILADYSQNGRDKQAFDSFMHVLYSQLNLDPVPGLLRPALDIYRNKQFFTGRPIVTALEEKNSPAMQYGPRTSPTAIGIGQVTGALPDAIALGPEQIQFLARAYGGTWGAYLLSVADAIGEGTGISRERADSRPLDKPIIRRFAQSGEAFQTRWKTEFYELNNEVRQLVRDFKKLKDEGNVDAVKNFAEKNKAKLGLAPAMGALQQRLAEVRNAYIKIEMNPKLTGTQKREKEDQLITAQNRILAGIRPLLQRAEGLPELP